MKNKFYFLIFIMLFGFNIFGQKANKKCISTEVEIKVNSCNIHGTLLFPKKIKAKPSLVIIVAGSGPTDRNGNNTTTLKSNSYKLLAEGLCKNKIACFRYDKRMIGKSIDSTISEIDLRFDTYVNDLVEITKYFKFQNKYSEIIIAGHSEGSLIGMIASNIVKADKYISISGIAESADITLKEQLKGQPKSLRKKYYAYIDTLAKGILIDTIEKGFEILFRKSVQPYMISWFKYNPTNEISKLKMPVLILQGTTDIQVKKENADLLHNACKQSELKIIEGMNHVLKKAPADFTENLKTYYNPDLKLHKSLLPTIIEFINKK